jgi:hypothetical protein
MAQTLLEAMMLRVLLFVRDIPGKLKGRGRGY